MTAHAPAQRRALRLARFRRACWWLGLGVLLLPLKPCSKHLQPGFGPHKARISRVSCARNWFLNTDANLGVLLGDPAGLVVADWDDDLSYQRWRAAFGVAVSTFAERTPRGVHLGLASHAASSPPPFAPLPGMAVSSKPGGPAPSLPRSIPPDGSIAPCTPLPSLPSTRRLPAPFSPF